MGDRGMAYVPRPDEAEADAVAAAPLDHVQRRFIRAGRILVAGGCLVLTHDAAAGSSSRAAHAEHALVGLALLLPGAALIMLSPAANRLPSAFRAVPDAVLAYLFAPPGN